MCDFLLLHHSNISPTLQHLKDISGFCAYASPLFHPNFWGLPVGPDRPWSAQAECRNLKLISHREIIFIVFQAQPM